MRENELRADDTALLDERLREMQAAQGPPASMPRTNWTGVALTLLLPSIVAVGFVWFALREEWNDTGEWAFGMLALIPLEFVRVVVLWILRDAYKDFRTPWQAVRFFLLSLLVLAIIGLVLALSEVGVRATFEALLEPQTWSIIGVPVAVIVIDGVIALAFFSGDRTCQAARLDAQGDDAQDWFLLTLWAFPFLVLLPGFVLFVVMQDHAAALPSWMPRPADGMRALCLLFVAAYFAGKGLLLAQVHVARFMATGRRVLGVRWVQFILERDAEKRRKNAKAESEKAARRRAVFAGARPVDEAAPAP